MNFGDYVWLSSTHVKHPGPQHGWWWSGTGLERVMGSRYGTLKSLPKPPITALAETLAHVISRDFYVSGCGFSWLESCPRHRQRGLSFFFLSIWLIREAWGRHKAREGGKRHWGPKAPDPGRYLTKTGYPQIFYETPRSTNFSYSVPARSRLFRHGVVLFAEATMECADF